MLKTKYAKNLQAWLWWQEWVGNGMHRSHHSQRARWAELTHRNRQARVPLGTKWKAYCWKSNMGYIWSDFWTGKELIKLFLKKIFTKKARFAHSGQKTKCWPARAELAHMHVLTYRYYTSFIRENDQERRNRSGSDGKLMLGGGNHVRSTKTTEALVAGEAMVLWYQRDLHFPVLIVLGKIIYIIYIFRKQSWQLKKTIQQTWKKWKCRIPCHNLKKSKKTPKPWGGIGQLELSLVAP